MSLRNDIRTLRRQVADLDRAVHALIEAHNQSGADPWIVVTEKNTLRPDGKVGKTRRYQFAPTKGGAVHHETVRSLDASRLRIVPFDASRDLKATSCTLGTAKVVPNEKGDLHIEVSDVVRYVCHGPEEEAQDADLTGRNKLVGDDLPAVQVLCDLRDRAEQVNVVDRCTVYLSGPEQCRCRERERSMTVVRVCRHGSSPSVVGGGAGTPVPGEATVGESAVTGAGSSPSCARGGGCRSDAPVSGASGQAAKDCTMRRLAGHCPMHDRQVQS